MSVSLYMSNGSKYSQITARKMLGRSMRVSSEKLVVEFSAIFLNIVWIAVGLAGFGSEDTRGSLRS